MLIFHFSFTGGNGPRNITYHTRLNWKKLHLEEGLLSMNTVMFRITVEYQRACKRRQSVSLVS